MINDRFFWFLFFVFCLFWLPGNSALKFYSIKQSFIFRQIIGSGRIGLRRNSSHTFHPAASILLCIHSECYLYDRPSTKTVTSPRVHGLQDHLPLASCILSGCVCECGSQRSKVGVFLTHLFVWHLFEIKSPTEPGTHWSVSWVPGVFLSSPQSQGHVTVTQQTSTWGLGSQSGLCSYVSGSLAYWVILLTSVLVAFDKFIIMVCVLYHSHKPGEFCWTVRLSSGLSLCHCYPWWDVEGWLALTGTLGKLGISIPETWTHSVTYSCFPKPITSFACPAEILVMV